MSLEEKNPTARQRRETILQLLRQISDGGAISASALAAKLGVSRQIVVGDIALLRASGEEILATPRGYLLQNTDNGGLRRTIACKHHSGDAMARELYAIVDNGGEVLDVIVEHPVYGQISGALKLRSRYDVTAFLEKVERYRAQPLSALTDGIHLHTVFCRDEETFLRITQALQEQGILLERG